MFDRDRTTEHEDAIARLANHLGLAGQRPEQDLGEGPDVLWALGDLGFWVIEAKSGSRSQVIHKTDANQLAGSMNWFRERYDPTARATPVMVHRAAWLPGELCPDHRLRVPGRRRPPFLCCLRSVTALN